MKKLLITGFEPFDNETINPSWDAVTRLPDEIGGYRLTKLLIPVLFRQSAEQVIDTANKLQPDVILCIGQAGGRSSITPEMLGINLRHATIPDNNGYQPIDEPIVVGGETAHFTTLPVRKIAESIKANGLPSQVSYSAGAYVCTEVIYTLLDYYKNTETRVGFIHVPYSTEQNKQPSMPLADIVKGLTIAIECL